MFTFFLSSFILFSGAVDDLFTRKIHNTLILFLGALAFAGVLFLKGTGGLMAGGLSAGMAFFLLLPFFLTKILGGGDLKLFVVFAFTVTPFEMFLSFVYALPWALLLGLIKLTFEKKLKDFFWNVYFLFRFKKPSSFHSIPFSVALFFGWMSYFSLKMKA